MTWYRIAWGFAFGHAAYSVARAVPGLLPLTLALALGALLPLGFAVAHGVAWRGAGGVARFAAVCLLVSNAAENCSILTGFPFGRYHYTDGLGPRLFLVPILISPAYLGMGYTALVLGRAAAGAGGAARAAAWGALAMTGWDLSFDPIVATVQGNWVWPAGGVYFGVPISNFLGWAGTVFAFLLPFGAAPAASGAAASPAVPVGPAVPVAPAILVYAATVGGNLLDFAFRPAGGSVTDPSGAAWGLHALYGTCALVGLFAIAPVLLAAAAALSPKTDTAPQPGA